MTGIGSRPNLYPGQTDLAGRTDFEHGGRFKPMKAILAIALGMVLTSACSMKVDEDGKSDNVDIRTPVGALRVRSDVDARDTGMAVYPGAKRKTESDSNDKGGANVNISSSLFGLKVVAMEYQSDDPPEKLIAYYKNELKQYGKVLECHGSGNDLDIHSESKQLTCEKGSGDGKTTELKAGTADNEHIVAVEPLAKGSKFALVYVSTRGKREPI